MCRYEPFGYLLHSLGVIGLSIFFFFTDKRILLFVLNHAAALFVKRYRRPCAGRNNTKKRLHNRPRLETSRENVPFSDYRLFSVPPLRSSSSSSRCSPNRFSPRCSLSIVVVATDCCAESGTYSRAHAQQVVDETDGSGAVLSRNNTLRRTCDRVQVGPIQHWDCVHRERLSRT